MSRHQLRGTAAWDDCGEGTASLGRDFRWEVGYDPTRITYYAQLWDDALMDPECPPTEEELARPLVWIGQMPYSVLSVEDLEREMDMELPEGLATRLREERERHLAGQLDEPAAIVRERLLTFRELQFRDYLERLLPFLPGPVP